MDGTHPAQATDERLLLTFIGERFGGRLRLRVREVAQLAGVPEQTLRNAAADGTLRLAPIREGRSVLYASLDLARLLAAGEPLIRRRRRGRPGLPAALPIEPA
ncbi:MAG: helix-turn-helix domain-containing protein [Tagaea sp.]